MTKENINPALFSVFAGTLLPLNTVLLRLNNLHAKNTGMPPVFSSREKMLSLGIDLGRTALLLLGTTDLPINLVMYFLTGLIASYYSVHEAGNFFSSNLKN